MASIAHAMARAGYQPVLTSLSDFEPRKYLEWFGIDISSYPPYISMGIRLRSFGLYMRLLVWYPVKIALRRYNPGIIFIDSPTYKPLINDLRRRNIKLIEYIHFPLDLSFRRKYAGLGYYYTEDQYMAERYTRFPLNIYAWLYSRLFDKFARENPFQVSTAVLTNSHWTASIIRMAFNEDPIVLNPPLPPNSPITSNNKPFDERRPYVVMVGRYAEEKRYHWVLENIAPKLIKEIPQAKVIIMGSTGTRTSESYYDYLMNISFRRDLRVGMDASHISNADVILMKNVPRPEMIKLLDESRVFFHATVNEHWGGIAVAEAMARGGLPVVVHKSGGAWSDLALNGEVGLSYENADEAVNALVKLLTDSRAWSNYSIKSLDRVRDITFDKFVDRLAELVRKIL
ncbi:glycosyltransferase family 4 protein [Vulcanisaeta distributa]|uniref:glycosyltransferase family 4 protein n=1 Tax=Vulcanisaeta distributa TaxID=164451 RepID=UPI000AF05FC6|nr:glycosyltransferase family 4 protein [Vulcanisaeta distributa]